ncbi:MAG: hypothetical protein OXI63_26220 [Candidatus Poribacteria bacterium]|nr:hypothetical protein [Candidatus Poribacteria bacterium]
MAGPKTDLKDALQQSGGKLSPTEPEAKEKAPPPVGRQQSLSRVGKKPVTVYYGKEAHLQLKILAAEQDTTIQELHKDALNALFVKHGKPPIA